MAVMSFAARLQSGPCPYIRKERPTDGEFRIARWLLVELRLAVPGPVRKTDVPGDRKEPHPSQAAFHFFFYALVSAYF